MTLRDTIALMERAAKMQPALKTIVRNDIFRLNSKPQAKYGVFGWTQGQHKGNASGSYNTYAFTLFYVDKLTNDKGNEIEIQSMGCSVLDSILRVMNDNGIYCGEYSLQVFNQRFADECAGVYATVSFDVPISTACPDYLAAFNNDYNDDFDII